MAKITIYTDGSADNNPQVKGNNRGGYGIVMINGTIKQYCGGQYRNTTSARMELLSVIRALEKCKVGDRVEIWNDNQYVVNSIEKGWIFKWSLQGWKKRENADLLKKLLFEYNRLERKVKLKWLRGHDGHHGNELADELARKGSKREIIIWDKPE